MLMVRLFLLVALLGTYCAAGDLVGKVTAPKPNQAVVFIEGVKGNYPAKNAEIDQQKNMFVPSVLAVLKGSKVAFHNDDALVHNVFGIGPDEFNLGNFRNGEVREHTFNKDGDVTLRCNVHPDMEGHVLVLDNPYFARPDASGKFQIVGVPPGGYTVKAWYNGKLRKQNVNVPPAGSVSVTF